MNRTNRTSVGVAALRDQTTSLTSTDVVKASRGFTLVELMTVVTIVGILGSMALPSYNQYTIRTRVVEALLMGGHAKHAVAEVAQSGQVTPAGYLTTYTPPPATPNVASVAVNPTTGVITMTTTARAGSGSIVFSPYTGNNSGLPNPTLPFSVPSGAVKWQCMAAGATSIVAGVAPGTLQSRYAPADCRQ